MDKEPQTLLEAIRYFSDPDVCLEYAKRFRWPSGQVACPTCGSTDVRFLSTRRIWECKARHERKQFSAKIGTIFEDSPIGFDKWFPAIWLICNDKNGISSYELARALGVTQRTAWFMMHRIREAMRHGSFTVNGEVEVDETFIGGKARNMHKAERKRKITGTGGSGKAVVMGLLERHGRVQVAVIPDRSRAPLHPRLRAVVKAGVHLMTDAFSGYQGLEAEYVHQFVDHAEKYVEGRIHTNGIENFWALLKRTLGGTYVSVEPFHLHRYLDEQAFRYNEREGTDRARFVKVVMSTEGKRLTYKKLTRRTDSDSPRGAGNALA